MTKAIIKSSVIGLALMSLAISSNAQWTRNAVSGFIYPTVLSDKIGIGTNTPSYQLDIKQPGVCSFRIQSQTSGSSNLILSRSAAAGQNCLVNYKTGTTDLWRTGASGNDNFSIINGAGTTNFLISQASGNVGIGTTTPQTKLHVVGGFMCADATRVNNPPLTATDITLCLGNTSGSYYPGINFYSDATTRRTIIYGITYAPNIGGIQVCNETGAYAEVNASAFNVSSDRRMKKDIEDINADQYANYLNQIRQIESATFRYNSETNESRVVPHLGVIAQSLPAAIQAHITEKGGKVSEERLGVSLADMQGLLVVGVKALDSKQTEFEAKLAEKDARIATLESKMAQFEQALAQCCSNFVPSAEKQATGNATDVPSLEQNQPNPFNQSSVVKFYIPSTFRTAELVITNLSGVTMKSIKITQSGVGQVTINASELQAGSYMYSLVIDGNKAISKKMELTK